jgi:hypothetical protein
MSIQTMKTLLALCLFIASSSLFAAEPPATVKGEVLETMNAGGYTYLRLKTQGGETWAAVNRATVNKGAAVTLENVMVMHDFESKSLKKTFPKILFATLAATTGGAAGGNAEMAAVHAGLAKSKDAENINVPKASGANAKTVAEIVKKAGELKDKPVLVRGKVVKYNAGIMGKNWIHLRDGSGSAANESNDILVTTSQQAKLSDVVTVQGVVRTDKDFGAGYVYKVLIEDAKLQP